jgi:hypothetical protein
LQNAQVILLTEVLTMTKKNIWLITSHSSHHWIFYLARNMITFLVYIEYQNFTRIRIEEIILQVLIFFAESNCLLICLTFWLLSKSEYTHIGTKSIHVVVSINVDTEILDLLDNCNYRSISEFPSVFSTLYWPFTVEMYKDVSNYHEERDDLQNGKKRYTLIVIHTSNYCVILSCFH